MAKSLDSAVSQTGEVGVRTQVRSMSRLAAALPYAHLDALCFQFRGSVDLAEEMGLHQRGPETREEHPDAADDQPESADEIGQHSEQESDDVIGQVVGDKAENLANCSRSNTTIYTETPLSNSFFRVVADHSGTTT